MVSTRFCKISVMYCSNLVFSCKPDFLLNVSFVLFCFVLVRIKKISFLELNILLWERERDGERECWSLGINVHCSCHHHDSVYVLCYRSRRFFHANVPLEWLVLPGGAFEMTSLAQVRIVSGK